MEVSRPGSAKLTTGTGVAAITLFLIATWSPQAFSASWSTSDCQESSTEIQPEMTLDGLTLDPVDHSAIEPTQSEIDAANLAGASKEQLTPFLYLAPRVASVIKDVFGESLNEPEEGSSSPLAESDEVTPYAGPVDNDLPETGDLDGSSLPPLQRQMYRIDI